MPQLIDFHRPDVVMTIPQALALARLGEAADLYGSPQMDGEGLQPRFTQLIAGPSGVGKDFIVRQFVKERHLTHLRIPVSCWQPSSTPGGGTLETIAAYLATGDPCCIQLDGIDNLRPKADPADRAVVDEICCLLDRRVIETHYLRSSWDESAEEALRQRCYILATGRWDAITAKASRADTGHGPRPTPSRFATAAEERIRAHPVIPQAVMDRFDPGIVILPALSALEVMYLADSFGLTSLVPKEEAERIAAGGLSFRALEALRCRRVIENRSRLPA